MTVGLVAVAASVLAGISASPAAGVTLVRPDGGSAYRYQAWADRALVPTAPETITLVRDGCPGHVEPACTIEGEPTIWLGWDSRRVLLHELGHRFDYTFMLEEDRAAFRALTGDRRSWRTSPNSPHEQFAEAWAMCARNGWRGRRGQAGDYGWMPSLRVHRAACSLIERAAARGR